eukprot:UN02967
MMSQMAFCSFSISSSPSQSSLASPYAIPTTYSPSDHIKHTMERNIPRQARTQRFRNHLLCSIVGEAEVQISRRNLHDRKK